MTVATVVYLPILSNIIMNLRNLGTSTTYNILPDRSFTAHSSLSRDP